MKTFEVEAPDGTVYRVDAPEGTPPAALIRMAQDQRAAQPQPLSASDRLLTSGAGRLLKGMKDPIDAGAQLLPRALSSVASGFGLMPNRVSEFLDKEAASVDSDIKASEQQYQAARFGAGQTGFDGMRLAGNVVNPATVALARVSPQGAATTLGRAWQGAIGGALGGAAARPVTDTSDLSFAAQKVGQGVAGAVGGAIAGPLFGKIVDVAAPRIKALQARFTDPEVLGARASLETDMAIRRVFVDMGIDEQNIPKQVMEKLRADVLASFKQGQKLDAAAALRKMDFDAQGVPALRGQVTRDPMQYSQDLNLRGVEGVGEPIQQLLQAQNRKITTDLGRFGGPSAAEPYQAGSAITSSLKAYDDDAMGAVRRAYQNARTSSGKDWEIPLGGFSSDVQTIVDDFGVGAERNAVPSAVFARLQKLGVVGDGMTQRKVFNYEEADKLLKQINSHMRGGDNASLSALHGAVKRAILEGGGEGDPFAPARRLAADRFKLLDAAPALKAVVEGKAAPDDFVQRFIIGGKVQELEKLKGIMSSDDVAEARRQIARVIYEGAFRGNATGDKAASPAGLQNAMRRIGTDKLKVFFSQSEIDELNRLTRITAYANTEPAAGVVARGGNPGGVLFGGIARLGGAGTAVSRTLPILGAGMDAGSRSLRAAAAMNPSVPKAANLTPEEVSKLAGLLGAANVSVGGLLAPGP